MDTYNLIKHITDSTIDNKLHFVTPSFNDPDVRFAIKWKRNDKLPWSFTLYGADNWTSVSQLDLLDALKEVECDCLIFRAQILDKILLQVAYLDLLIKDTRELLGDDVVDHSIKAHEDFAKSIVDTIKNVMNPPSKLSLVKD